MNAHKFPSAEKRERERGNDSDQVISQIMERLNAAYNFLPPSLRKIADKVIVELQELLKNKHITNHGEIMKDTLAIVNSLINPYNGLEKVLKTK